MSSWKDLFKKNTDSAIDAKRFLRNDSERSVAQCNLFFTV